MPSTTYYLDHAIVTIHVRREWNAKSFDGAGETPLYLAFCEAVRRVANNGQAESRDGSIN